MHLILIILYIKVVSFPNLQIIDFSYGHTGSTHDATAWQETHIAQNHNDIFEEGEFIWADSAYSVCFQYAGKTSLLIESFTPW